MATLSEFQQYWISRIPRDLAPFKDPGTSLDVTTDARALGARWEARNRVFEARFTIAPDGVQVSFQGRNISYRSFLAGPEMADLLGLAKMILQAQPQTLFVPTKARRADQDTTAAGSAIDLLQSLLETPADLGLTGIFMVTGEAGAGKTRVLRELVRQQAARYVQGRSDRLYLYVNAQGRALARFHEALATELQDLRASVTYHAVSALVRLGVLVPIIDGFDELLGVGGYDDAFSSLSAFIEELDGLGQLIASARSTYYEQEFIARASSISSLGAQAWMQFPIEILAWEESEFENYVTKRAQEKGLGVAQTRSLTERVRRVFAGNSAPLRRKPLFVARTVDLLLEGVDVQGGADLLDELVRLYLERERREKLLDRSGNPLLTASQIDNLMRSLAEEMWNLETRELDRRTVKEVAEYVLVSEGVGEAEQRVVVERMPSLAFLMPGERPGAVAFEHEMFFARFLSLVFARQLDREESGLALLLGRSVLPLEVARRSVAIVLGVEEELREIALEILIRRLNDAAIAESPRSSQTRENAGVLAAEAIKAWCSGGKQLTGIRVRRIIVPGGDLDGVEVRDSVWEGVEFRRVDLSRTKFLDSRAIEVSFIEVTVDPSHTRLELAGFDARRDILGLRRRSAGGVLSLYDPTEIHQTLAACGAVPSVEERLEVWRVDQRIAGLVERLVRAYGRSNPVCKADDNLRHLFGDRMWSDLERVLVEVGIVTKEGRTTGGRPKEFLRRQFLPEQIMAGANKQTNVPVAIRRFWSELERRFPLKAD